MKYQCLKWVFLSLATTQVALAQDNLFALPQGPQVFAEFAQMVEYIKTEKPTTYRYFERLNPQFQERVFAGHKQAENLTDLVMQVYRQQISTSQASRN